MAMMAMVANAAGLVQVGPSTTASVKEHVEAPGMSLEPCRNESRDEIGSQGADGGLGQKWAQALHVVCSVRS